jgi:hypothetical protein
MGFLAGTVATGVWLLHVVVDFPRITRRTAFLIQLSLDGLFDGRVGLAPGLANARATKITFSSFAATASTSTHFSCGVSHDSRSG